MGSRNRRPSRKNIARERIDILFYQAERFAAEGELNLSDLCVKRARQIAMRERIRLCAIHNRKFCRRCCRYFVPAKTSRIRIYRGVVTVTCLQCGYQRRYPLKKRRDQR
ncbi:MAG: ribonuclease P [Methanospirillaceae archaeon]|nr:ribonuclease P [Methanospirillaceae archaeon]